MIRGSSITEPGCGQITINGKLLDVLPGEFNPSRTLRKSVFTTMAGGAIASNLYAGDGLPDVLNTCTFEMPYELDENVSSLAETIDLLAASADVHTLSFWKQQVYQYTARVGQQVFWLPRPDAYTAGYPDAADASLKAVVIAGGVTLPVVYQNTVTDASAVTAGEAWVSKTVVAHPDTGRLTEMVKLGTPIAVQGTKVLIKYYELFNVLVTNAPTEYLGVNRERKTLYLVEAA